MLYQLLTMRLPMMSCITVLAKREDIAKREDDKK